jgi:hypothetical protein
LRTFVASDPTLTNREGRIYGALRHLHLLPRVFG